MSQTHQSHYTPSTNTPAQQYESRHRLTWAAHYPLKPGRDVMSRRGLLVLIADTAITGTFYESQQKLAERAGMSARGVRKTLAKLCAEGALWARPRGFKRTTRYTLQRLDEVAKHGDFLPVETNPSSPQAPLERNHSTSQTPTPPPFERNHSTSQIAFERNHSSYKEDIKHEVKPPLTPPLILPAPEPEKISPTARRLHDYIVQGTGRPLPASWVSYPELKQRVDPLNFQALASVLAATVERMGGYLPDPEDFFKTYAEKAVSTSKRKTKRKRKRRAA